jgi:acetolactate synthase-1/2/3 large subunit
MTHKMKCSDFIAKKISNYTNHIFSGQGGSVVHILDSLSKIKKIKIIPSQNEQGASLAADAYSRTTNKIGVVIATSGPGILNAIQGMACSYYDSIPALYISGAPVTSALKKNKKLRQLGFQEMEIKDIVKSITKYSVRITDTNQVNYEIEKCISIATSGRPGPVLIDLPDDIQRSSLNIKEQKEFLKKKIQYKINSGQLIKLKNLIKNSKKPLIIIGNGVKISKTSEAIKKIINKYKIPFSTTWATTDLFKSEHPLNAGSFGVYATRYGNFAVQNSDLLIIIGSRLNGTHIGTAKLFSPKSKRILIDIDKNELNEENQVKIDLKINSDIKEIVKKKWLDSLKYAKISPQWLMAIKKWKEKYPIVSKKFYEEKNFTNPYVFFERLSEYTKKNDILIPDASANLVWFYQAYKPKSEQNIFTALNHSPMGYSIAASIGACLGAKKNQNVIASIGDGSVQMNIQEIENIKNFNLPIKIFILDNSGYGMVKQTIDVWLNKNYVGCDKGSGLSIPNFIKIFNAYGIKSIEIKNNKEIDQKLKFVMKYKGPIMCNVKISENARIIPKTKPGDPLHDMLPKLTSSEISHAMSYSD